MLFKHLFSVSLHLSYNHVTHERTQACTQKGSELVPETVLGWVLLAGKKQK